MVDFKTLLIFLSSTFFLKKKVFFCRSIAIDLATKGIRCNAVCPGVIDTGMIDRLKASKIDIEEMVKGMQPIGRMGTPDEVAAAVVWLSSNAASFVTGAALDVDGGWLAR